MNRSGGFFEEPSSKLFNISTNHPIIPNANDYIIYKKYVSIHSEDRDVLKYPNSNQFEIDTRPFTSGLYVLKLHGEIGLKSIAIAIAHP